LRLDHGRGLYGDLIAFARGFSSPFRCCSVTPIVSRCLDACWIFR
jgi:hypothetical protein